VTAIERAAICPWTVRLFVKQWTFLVNGMDFGVAMPEGVGGRREEWLGTQTGCS
jgi:hypothetical protein